VTRVVELAGQAFTVDAIHRLALAVAPVARPTRGPVGPGIRVGREVPRPPSRRRRRGEPLDPLGGRLDVALDAHSSVFTLRHRLDIPLPPPGSPLVGEVVLRLDDPARRYVPRRLRVPMWSRWRVEEPDSDPAVATVKAEARTVTPWMLPGSAYQPPGGATGLRGRLLRHVAGQPDEPVPWPRLRALGPANEVVGHAHGDDRGEFLLLVETTGTIPPPPPSKLPIRLAVWVPDPAAQPPPNQLIAEGDPLGELVIEDAVRRVPGAPPGSVDAVVLRGEAIPASYLRATLAPRPAEDFTVGELVQPDPYYLA
jgi:hypothetical protein